MTRADVLRLALEAGFTWEPINNIADPLELQPIDQTLRFRDAPRMPRNTEPCPLWQFGLIAGLVLVALGVAGAGLIYGLGLTLEAFDSYATAFLRGLVRWAQ